MRARWSSRLSAIGIITVSILLFTHAGAGAVSIGKGISEGEIDLGGGNITSVGEVQGFFNTTACPGAITKVFANGSYACTTMSDMSRADSGAIYLNNSDLIDASTVEANTIGPGPESGDISVLTGLNLNGQELRSVGSLILTSPLNDENMSNTLTIASGGSVDTGALNGTVTNPVNGFVSVTEALSAGNISLGTGLSGTGGNPVAIDTSVVPRKNKREQISKYWVFQENVTVGKNLNVIGNITEANVNTLNVNGSIVPPGGFGSVFDIGEQNGRWRVLYVDRVNATGDINTSGNVNVAGTTDGVDLDNPGDGLQLTGGQYAVLTGTGLTTSGGNIIIASGGVDTSQLAAGAVTNGKIGFDAVNRSQLAQSGASNGQVLKWDGDAWVPQSDDTGAGGSNFVNITGDRMTGDLNMSGNAVRNVGFLNASTITVKNAFTDGNISDTLSVDPSSAVAKGALNTTGTLAFVWTDAEVSDTLSAAPASSVAKGAINSTGTLAFDWGDTEIADSITVNAGGVSGTLTDNQISDTLTLNLLSTVNKSDLADAGTLGYDWGDGEVSDSLTVNAAGVTGTLTDSQVSDALTVNLLATVNKSDLTSAGALGFTWTDAEVADTLSVAPSSSVAKGALNSTGTLGFDWTDNEVSDSITVEAGGLTAGPVTVPVNAFVSVTDPLSDGNISDSITVNAGGISGTVANKINTAHFTTSDPLTTGNITDAYVLNTGDTMSGQLTMNADIRMSDNQVRDADTVQTNTLSDNEDNTIDIIDAINLGDHNINDVNLLQTNRISDGEDTLLQLQDNVAIEGHLNMSNDRIDNVRMINLNNALTDGNISDTITVSGGFVSAGTPLSTGNLSEGAVTAVKIANGAVNGTHIMQNGATSGQVLEWNGNAWAPAQDNTGQAGSNFVNITGDTMTGDLNMSYNNIQFIDYLNASTIDVANPLTDGNISNSITVNAGGISGTLTDGQISDTLTLNLLNTVNKSDLTNAGTLSFDWGDGEVADGITVDASGLTGTVSVPVATSFLSTTDPLTAGNVSIGNGLTASNGAIVVQPDTGIAVTGSGVAIATGGVDTAQLSGGAVTGDELATGIVNESHIVGTATTGSLVGGGGTKLDVSDGGIGSTELGVKAVTADKIDMGAVNKSHIGSSAVGSDELDSTASFTMNGLTVNGDVDVNQNAVQDIGAGRTNITGTGAVDAGADVNMNNNNVNDVASVDGGGDAVRMDDDIDMNGNSVTSSTGEVCIGDECS